ncbi:hypothetical protein ACFXDH_34165 [Streptomyces sp. NPDC059467]|uniref:hypothetical protein n=1 Tax=Streptomyces sp. NPDC059467 TaxID=3346844 RepID=UPI00367BDA29
MVQSDRCGLDQLIGPYSIAEAVRERLVLGEGRPRRWSSTWWFAGGEVVWPVRDLASVPVLGSEPVRRFTWRARQRHRPGLQFAPAWGPGEDHSPNSLFSAAMQQGGFALQIPRPELCYRLLKAHYVKIHPRRGVKIGGLWYHAVVLDDPRFHVPSTRGGRHKGKWLIRSDRRDRRTVFFQDDMAPDRWHLLRWTGLPPEGEIPAFSDRAAETLLAEARRRGLAPRSDAELLPVLLELLGSAIPVAQWPTQMTKRERSRRSRQHAQTEAAAADRAPTAASGRGGDAEVLAWPEQARTVQDSVDADRHRRRGRRRHPRLGTPSARTLGRHHPPVGDAALPAHARPRPGGHADRTPLRPGRTRPLPLHHPRPDRQTFYDHLAGLEDSLRLLNAEPGMLTSGTMPEYLMRRTDGVVGLLERLVEDGCQEAMDSGKETLDEDLLDEIILSLDDPDRDPHAGEIPSIPGSSPQPRQRSKAARNTVLDDCGPAAG